MIRRRAIGGHQVGSPTPRGQSSALVRAALDGIGDLVVNQLGREQSIDDDAEHGGDVGIFERHLIGDHRYPADETTDF